MIYKSEVIVLSTKMLVQWKSWEMSLNCDGFETFHKTLMLKIEHSVQMLKYFCLLCLVGGEKESTVIHLLISLHIYEVWGPSVRQDQDGWKEGTLPSWRVLFFNATDEWLKLFLCGVICTLREFIYLYF
jgi:hypothetical protein